MRGSKAGQYAVRTASWKMGFLVLAYLLTDLVAQAQQTSPRPVQSESTSVKQGGTLLDQLLDRALKAEGAGRMAEAEQLYLSALAEAEKLGDSSPRLADVLDSVANVYHRKGDFEKAIGFSERALAIDEAAPGSNPMRVGRDLNRLALLYQQQNPEEAERYVQMLLELAGDLPPKSNLVRILFLRDAAEFYRRQGRNVEAETLLKQALQIEENAPRQDEMRAELASLYADEGKPEEAERILRDAVKTGQAATGKVARQDHSVPFDLMRLAKQYKDEARLKPTEAASYGAVALAIAIQLSLLQSSRGSAAARAKVHSRMRSWSTPSRSAMRRIIPSGSERSLTSQLNRCCVES
jgi:tetratricopeptide (TPR) repeat protein